MRWLSVLLKVDANEIATSASGKLLGGHGFASTLVATEPDVFACALGLDQVAQDAVSPDERVIDLGCVGVIPDLDHDWVALGISQIDVENIHAGLGGHDSGGDHRANNTLQASVIDCLFEWFKRISHSLGNC